MERKRAFYLSFFILFAAIVALGIFWYATQQEDVEEEETPPSMTPVRVPPTITYTPSSEIDQEIKRFGVTGEVIEADARVSILRVTGSSQEVYTVVISSSTEITKNGSKIALSEIQAGDRVSVIASENIKEKLSFEAESVYATENIGTSEMVPF